MLPLVRLDRGTRPNACPTFEAPICLKITMNKFPTYLSTVALICLATTSFGQVSRIRTLVDAIRPKQATVQMHRSGGLASPSPFGVSSYPLYLTSTQLGTPELIVRETSFQPSDSLTYAYQGHMTYQGGRPSTAIIVDSNRRDTLSREDYTFSATGKILSVKTYSNMGSGLQPTSLEAYTYDRNDSVATYDRYLYDLSGGLARTEGTHYNRTYDGSGRVTEQIDSSYDQASDRFWAVSKTEFTYQGTATAPRQVTFSDSSGGSFEPSIRLARIVWNNVNRFWITSADVQIPLTGSIFITFGSMAGVLTGQEFATTISYRTSLTGPLQPQLRTTTGFNAQGDKIRNMNESYDSASASWTVNQDERYVHTYGNPGGKLSRMVHYSYDIISSQLYKQEAYSYGALPVTSARPKQVAAGLTPNPATNRVLVSGRSGATGQILAATGQQVRSFQLGVSGKTEVRLEGLAPGIYQVKVEGFAPSRLVVE